MDGEREPVSHVDDESENRRKAEINPLCLLEKGGHPAHPATQVIPVGFGVRLCWVVQVGFRPCSVYMSRFMPKDNEVED